MSFGMPDFAEILYKVRVTAPDVAKSEDPAKSVLRYGIDFAVLPQDVKLETSADGVRSGSIEVGIIAYDDEGKPLNAVGKKVPIRIQPDLFAKIQQGGFKLHEEIDLPKTSIFLLTGIYDLTAHRVGTLEIPLHVGAAPAISK
jgi:hypothetical protein